MFVPKYDQKKCISLSGERERERGRKRRYKVHITPGGIRTVRTHGTSVPLVKAVNKHNCGMCDIFFTFLICIHVNGTFEKCLVCL